MYKLHAFFAKRPDLSIGLFLLSFKAISQSQNTRTAQQLWLEFEQVKPINERYNYATQLGGKTIYPRSWYRFYINPKISYLRPKRIFKTLDYKESINAGLEIDYNTNLGFIDILEIKFSQGYSLKNSKFDTSLLKT